MGEGRIAGDLERGMEVWKGEGRMEWEDIDEGICRSMRKNNCRKRSVQKDKKVK